MFEVGEAAVSHLPIASSRSSVGARHLGVNGNDVEGVIPSDMVEVRRSELDASTRAPPRVQGVTEVRLAPHPSARNDWRASSNRDDGNKPKATVPTTVSSNVANRYGRLVGCSTSTPPSVMYMRTNTPT